MNQPTAPATETYLMLSAAEKGARQTCPACLRLICTDAAGRIVRHGWKETGRRVGSFGNGYQWGACAGWNDIAIEISDRDALRHYAGLTAAAEQNEAEAKNHGPTTGAASYAFSFRAKGWDARRWVDAGRDLPEAKTMQRGRVSQLMHTVQITPDLASLINVPKYAALRSRTEKAYQDQAEGLRRMAADLDVLVTRFQTLHAAAAKAKAAPAPAKAATADKGAKAPRLPAIGTVLRHGFKGGNVATCVVTGAAEVTYLGEAMSPSAAARAACGGSRRNGYTFWK